MPDSVVNQETSSLDALMSYREGYKNLFRVVLMLALGILAMACVLLYYVSSVLPQDRFYAMTSNGQKMQMIGLPAPNIGVSALLDWSAQAASEILTFGFDDIEDRFALSRRHFSPEGWESFGAAMGRSDILKSITARQQIMTAIPTSPPIILGEGRQRQYYGWLIEVPMVLTVRSTGEVRPIRTSVRMIVVRLPTSENPAGLGIYNWKQ